MSNKKKILSGISVDFAGSIMATIIGFAVVPYYFKYITIAEFGLWIAISGVMALITMADLGTDQYLTTVTANDEKFYDDSYGNYLSSILIIKTIVALLFGLIATFLYIFLGDIIDIDILHIEEAKIAFILGVITLLLGLFFSTIYTVLYARHHYSLINSFISIFAILTSLSTVLFISLGYGIISFPLALLVMTIIQYTFLLVYLIKKYPNIKIKIKGFHFVDKKDIIGYTTTFQVLRWVHTLRTQYITVAINNLVGPVYTAKYNLTNKIPLMVPSYAIKIVHPFFPIIADLFHKEDIEKVGNIFIRISKFLFRVAFFFAISVFFLNEAFISLWIGIDTFAGNSIMIWLIFYMAVYIAMAIFGIIIYSSKKFERWTMWSIVEIISAISLSYILSFDYGLLGIVAGFVLSSMITQVYLFSIVLKQLDMKKISFLNLVLRYSIPSNILPLCFGLLLFYTFTIHTWLEFIVCGLIFVLLAFIIDLMKIMRSTEVGIKNKVIKVLIP